MYTRTVLAVLLFALSSISGQYLSEGIDDRTFLETLQFQVQKEVEQTRENLVEQAHVLESATLDFAATKLKENFFKALRYLAERELETVSMQDRLRQPRMYDDSRNNIQELLAANILKTGFQIDKSMFESLLVRARELPDEDEDDSKLPVIWTSRVELVTDEQLDIPIAGNNTENGNDYKPPVLELTTLKPDNFTKSAQLEIHSTSEIPVISTTGTTTKTINGTTEHPAIFKNGTAEEEPAAVPGIIYIDVLAKDLQQGLSELIKNFVPEIFKGAKEALGLLEKIRDIYDN